MPSLFLMFLEMCQSCERINFFVILIFYIFILPFFFKCFLISYLYFIFELQIVYRCVLISNVSFAVVSVTRPSLLFILFRFLSASPINYSECVLKLSILMGHLPIFLCNSISFCQLHTSRLD